MSDLYSLVVQGKKPDDESCKEGRSYKEVANPPTPMIMQQWRNHSGDFAELPSALEMCL